MRSLYCKGNKTEHIHAIKYAGEQVLGPICRYRMKCTWCGEIAYTMWGEAIEPRTLEDAVHAIEQWQNDRPEWAVALVSPKEEKQIEELRK